MSGKRRIKAQPEPEGLDEEFYEELQRNPYDGLRDYKNKPRWINEEAVAALVNKLRDAELEEERYFYTVQQFQLSNVELPAATTARLRALLTQAARKQPPPPTAEERAAMEAAQRGEPEQLACLVETGRCHPEVALLAGQFIRGERDPRTGKQQRPLDERDPRTGKLRRKRGPSKVAMDERRQRNPVHNAADEFEVVREMLWALYPEQVATEINHCAERIAKNRTGTRVSVSNYRKRAKKTGHKIK